MSDLTSLKGIGTKVAAWLIQADIKTASQLRSLGAIEAYLQILEKTDFRANILLLYSLVGAIEDRDWNEVALNDKARLKSELEGLLEIGVIAKKSN